MNEHSQYPRVKSDLRFYNAGEGLYHVYDSASTRHFKMGETEVGWIKLLDGSRSKADFREIVPEQHYDTFFSNLNNMGLMDGVNVRPRLNLFKLQFRFSNPVALMDRMGAFAVFYRNVINAISPILMCANIAMVAIFWKSMTQSAKTAHPAFATAAIAYLSAVFLVSVVHEFSHAVTAKSFGVNTTAIGIMLYFLQPAFYVDVSGIGVLQKRSQRINVMLAGVMSNNLMASLALLAYFWYRQSSFSAYCVYFFLLNVFMVILNMIPFIEFDGYFIFREMVGEAEFGDNARSSLRKGTNKSFEYGAYAILSHLFSAVMVLSAILALRGYAWRAWNDDNVNRVAILLMCVMYVLLFKHLLVRIRYRQEDPHIARTSKSALWIYRGSVMLVTLACGSIRELWHLQFAGLIAYLFLFASLFWLVHICSGRADEICRQIFNVICIFAALKFLLYAAAENRLSALFRVPGGLEEVFGIAQNVCLVVMVVAAMIVFLFFAMSMFAYILLYFRGIYQQSERPHMLEQQF
jgi:putative peptide zinc metalloprotease protein